MKTTGTSAAVLGGLIGMLFASPVPAVNLTDGLVAYFPFDGNANDASGHGHNGIVEGATLTSDRFGNAQGAYAFGGGSAKIAAPLASTVFAGDFTASIWFNASDINTGWPTLLQEQNDSFLLGISGLLCGCDAPGYLLSYSSYAPATMGWSLFRTEQTPIGTFNQAVITREGEIVTMYLNSHVEVQGTVSDPTTVSGDWLWIGGSGGGYAVQDPGGSAFHGVLDEVRIYERALSSQEVALLYAFETPAFVPEGRVLWSLIPLGLVLGYVGCRRWRQG